MAGNHDPVEQVAGSWLLAANSLGAPMQGAGAEFLESPEGAIELRVEHANAREHAGGGVVILSLRNVSPAPISLTESLSSYEFSAVDYFERSEHTPVYSGPAIVFELQPGQTRVTEQVLWRGSQNQPEDYAIRMRRLSYMLKAA